MLVHFGEPRDQLFIRFMEVALMIDKYEYYSAPGSCAENNGLTIPTLAIFKRNDVELPKSEEYMVIWEGAADPNV